MRAQQAILPRKGRQRDNSAPTGAEPIRRLPERLTGRPLEPRPNNVREAPPLSPHIPDRPQATDRLRSLVRGEVSPAAGSKRRGSARCRGHRFPPAAVVVAPAATQAASIRNRWKIFPAPPWRRYDSAISTPSTPLPVCGTRSTATRSRAIIPFSDGGSFFSFTGSSETLAEDRRVPVPTGASTADPGETGFFGRRRAVCRACRISVLASTCSAADAGFRPVDWEIRVTSGVQRQLPAGAGKWHNQYRRGRWHPPHR